MVDTRQEQKTRFIVTESTADHSLKANTNSSKVSLGNHSNPPQLIQVSIFQPFFLIHTDMQSNTQVDVISGSL